MSRVYDCWERLVDATLKKEELRRIALSPSMDSSFSSNLSFDFSSRFSFNDNSPFYDVNAPSSSSSASIWLDYDVQAIAFKELEKATEGFSSHLIIGQGGFGPVFKGWIHESTLTAATREDGMTIAVKKWNPNGIQGGAEWLNEINYLSKLRHPNLVKLIGYCSEDNNLLLVYEDMPNGSLENLLFKGCDLSFPLDTRIKVAIGAARGLSFLHDMEIKVIHGGFKAADILLDKEFNAKLSNFGSAKDSSPDDIPHVSTQTMGTYCYASPHYIKTGHLTTKHDVYGFGIFLLELLSAHRIFKKTRFVSEDNLFNWAKLHFYDKAGLDEAFDIRYRYYNSKLHSKGAEDAAFIIALQCLNPNPKLRPPMSEVLVALEKL